MTNTHLLLLSSNPPTFPARDDFWMPKAASTTVEHVDWIWHFMIWISVVSSVLILGAMIYFCFKYKAKSRKANEVSEKSTDHNTTLEIAWSVVPMFVVVALFVWGFRGYVELRTPPQGALEIRATGQKWKWLFEYPNGYTDDTLHVPKGQPVRIIINAVDVLHALYIPNFRVKMDAVPGRYTELWFNATIEGDFPIECAEYCGTSHSDMLAHVIVHPPGGYEAWLKKIEDEVNNMPPVELGKLLADKQGCMACHTVDGSPKIGPTWKGIFGHEVATSTGTVKIDENYIHESILDPTAKVVSGFTPSMPTYKGKLNDKQINGIVEYIKSLK